MVGARGMHRRAQILAGVVFFLLGSGGVACYAASVVLKIQAINPSPTEKQVVEARKMLPKFAGPDDVIELGNFKIGYDVVNKAHYVYQNVEVPPGTSLVFEVRLKDIWNVPTETLQEAGDHARLLADSLKGTDQMETGLRLQGLVDQNLKTVRERQESAAIGMGHPVVDHIATYESNLQILQQLRKDIGVMENLVIAAGKDPRKILGAAQVPPPPDAGSAAATGNVVVIKFKVTNPSLTQKKSIDIRRDLAAEIKPSDIVGAGGLLVGFDSVKGVTCVYTNKLELEPNGSREFSVQVHNPWAGLPAKLGRLQTRANELYSLAKGTKAYESVESDIKSVVDELQSLAQVKAPEGMNEQYVVYARKQSMELSRIEGRVMRVEELFQPREKPQNIFGAPMLNVKPPSRRSTWIIIYSILGFLGVVSLLFYLRWYGKTKAEQLDQETGQVSDGSDSSKDSGGGASGKT